MGYINDDDSQSISYSTQGELIINGKTCSPRKGWTTGCNERTSESSSCDDSISVMSWATQHGKHVSLFEPETPWHIMKMKNIMSSSSEPSEATPEKPKEEFQENDQKRFLDFNTIACSLLFLIVFLFIIRYYLKS